MSGGKMSGGKVSGGKMSESKVSYIQPELGIEGKYMRGGYITRKWGSLNGGNIDCIQMKVPQWVRDDSRPLYGEKLGRAFAKWVEGITLRLARAH